MDEAGSENGGQSELTIDSPEVLDFIKFLDEFDKRIEAHKRAVRSLSAAVADGAIGRRLQQSIRTVFDMRQAVTDLRSKVQAGTIITVTPLGTVSTVALQQALTDILKIGV